MPDHDREERAIATIHEQGLPMVLAVTGGGSGLISALLRVPGASRTVLEAIVPYSQASLVDWLGAVPENFCSAETARAMAMRAYSSARNLAKREQQHAEPVLGLACTAGLATTVPKRGDHRIHWALQAKDRTVSKYLRLEKNRRSRQEEEHLAMQMGLNLLLEELELPTGESLTLISEEHITTERTLAPAGWQQLLAGETSIWQECGPPVTNPPAGRVLFPGAFNPLHSGHRQMAETAREILGRPVDFEISILNVDKPPLDFTEMAHRRAEFTDEEVLWFTRCPTFLEKAERFPGATFVVGADTMIRLADPKYYGGDRQQAEAAFRGLRELGARFLVFGRVEADVFHSLSDLDLPQPLRERCQEVPESDFRLDISSTEIRQRDASASERDG